MQLKDMKRQIEKDSLERLYVVHGREAYIIDEMLGMLRGSLEQSMLDFNYKVIEGETADFSIIRESAQTLPFMDKKRVTIVKELPAIKGGKSTWSDEQIEQLAEYLKKIPETSVVVFVSYSDIDKRKKLSKQMIKAGKEVNCNKLKGSELISWVKSKFEKAGLSITNSNIIYFLKISDYENKNSPKTLMDVENDIMKISSYLCGSGEVGKDSIDKLSADSLENDIFRLIDCIGAKKGAKAVKMLDDMLLQGSSGIMVLSMVGKQFRTMLQAKELRDLGYSQSAIAKQTGAHQFVVKKVLSEGQKFTSDQIRKILNECSEIDFSIKTGLVEEKIGVEVLISTLCSQK